MSRWKRTAETGYDGKRWWSDDSFIERKIKAPVAIELSRMSNTQNENVANSSPIMMRGAQTKEHLYGSRILNKYRCSIKFVSCYSWLRFRIKAWWWRRHIRQFATLLFLLFEPLMSFLVRSVVWRRWFGGPHEQLSSKWRRRSLFDRPGAINCRHISRLFLDDSPKSILEVTDVSSYSSPPSKSAYQLVVLSFARMRIIRFDFILFYYTGDFFVILRACHVHYNIAFKYLL